MNIRRIADGSEESMWQMTLSEIDCDKVKPIEEPKPNRSIYYWCAICGKAVGIFGPRSFHEQGWLYKRDICENGHIVDWT